MRLLCGDVCFSLYYFTEGRENEASYRLLNTSRRLARLHVPHLQLGTLRLIKIGGWVRQPSGQSVRSVKR